ncbi:D-alanine--D-alanine ligase, partial [Oleiphilus sp. HI0043]|uniref:D-alanine--D-alanine ligase n=2 Tax=Oleiphilus TaxID=141450 RepID=UPI0008388AB5
MSSVADKLGKVAVIMGGTSAEREVSLKSGQAVLDGLLRKGVDAFKLDFGGEIEDLVKHMPFDRAFLALHGRGGEDGTIQGVLETLNIPYSGSGVMGSAIGMDKTRTKYLWQGMNLPTPKFSYVEKLNPEMLTRLVSLMGFPLAVKPSREGSSIGVFKVNNQTQLEAAVSKALEMDEQVLLEQWIEGDEYTVGLLNGSPLPVIGLKTSHTFYDYEAKYESDSTQYLLPSGLSDEEEQSLGNLAERAFSALGCSGWGRVDVMRDSKGRFWLLEVNTIPGMTSHSLVPMAAKASGLEFDDLLLEILKSAVTNKRLSKNNNND